MARSTPRRMSTSAIFPATLPSATPSAWYLAPAGLHRGPSTLKTVLIESSLRGTAAKRNDGWRMGANRNPMPASSTQRATASGARSTLTPSCSSTSAEPHSDEAARLPCLATRAPQAAATIADSVEILKVARPSPPVPQVSRSAPSISIGVAIARAVRANPVSSSTVSPLMRSATRKPAICTAVASPRMISSKLAAASSSESGSPLTSLAMASIIDKPPPGAGGAGRWLERPEGGIHSHASLASRDLPGGAPEEIRQDLLAFLGEHRLGVELHPIGRLLRVSQPHNRVVRCPCRDDELIRDRSTFHDERVITRCLEGIADAGQHARVVVPDP